MPGFLSDATRTKIRTYLANEPSFTIAFAAWDLKIHRTAIDTAIAELLQQGRVKQIEPRSGPYAAVYVYVEREAREVPALPRVPLPDLDAAIRPDLAPVRGAPVPHTRARAALSRQEKKRTERVKVSRARRGT